jgi:hypothetical protein
MSCGTPSPLVAVAEIELRVGISLLGRLPV